MNIARPEARISKHKFSVGQTVVFSPGFRGSAGKGNYTVVRLLPDEGDTPQYRIKSTRDGQERMALESELARLPSTPATNLFSQRPASGKRPR